MTIARIKNNGDLQIKDEIIEYPAELEGGRNYFRPSLVNNLAWVSTGGIGYGILRSGPNWRGFYIPVKPGEIYSLSRTEIINNRFGVYFTEEEPADEIPVLQKTYRNDTALKIEGIEVPEGANYLFVYLSNQADELPKIKLEKGPVATPWTPAPEDLGLEYPDDIQHFSTGFRSNGKVLVHEFIEGEDFSFSYDKKMYLNELEEGVDL